MLSLARARLVDRSKILLNEVVASASPVDFVASSYSESCKPLHTELSRALRYVRVQQCGHALNDEHAGSFFVSLFRHNPREPTWRHQTRFDFTRV